MAYKGIKVTLSADTTAIVANGLSSTTIVASVADDNGTSLSDGTEVIFNILPGGSGSVLSPSFTVGGTAMTKLTSSTTPDMVRVEAQVVNSRDTIAVVFKKIFLILTANPTDILSNGASTSTITALLKDADSNPVVSSEIQFSSTLGVIPRSAITDANGRATVKLISQRTEGIAIITARHSNIERNTQVIFTGIDLAISATPVNLIVDDPEGSLISVTLTDAAETPIVGEPVELTTTLGNLFIEVDTTDVRGRVKATLSSSAAGKAIVTAKAAGVSGEVSITFTALTFEIEADPDTFIANVGSSLISASLLDENQPVEGAEIDFSTTLGKIEPFVAFTDSDGRAESILTSAGAGRALVTAIAKRGTDTISKTIEVEIKAALPASIELSVSPSIVRVDGGTSTLIAVASDSAGNPIPDATISFTTISGPSGGENINPGTAATNSSGVATTTFTSGFKPSKSLNDVQIVAMVPGAEEIRSNVVKLTIAGAPFTLEVGFIPPPRNNGDGTFDLPVSAVVADINGNPVADGTLVHFGIDEPLGVIQSPAITVNGKAQTTFTYPRTMAGRDATIRTQTGSIEKNQPFIIPGFTGTVADVVLSADINSVLGNGIETLEITALVRDTEGNPVGDIVVDFSANFGSIEPSAKTGAQFLEFDTINLKWGAAKVKLQSPAVTSEEGLIDTVRARVGERVADPITVEYRGISLEASANPESVSVNGAEATVTAVLKEAKTKIPIQGATIEFGTQLGTMAGFATTDETGVATSILKSGNRFGVTNVIVIYGAGISDTVGVKILPLTGGEPASIQLESITSRTIGVRGSGGRETTDLTFRVVDSLGRNASDTTQVTFKISGATTGGESLSPTSARTFNGLVTTTLRSGTKAGAVQIIATTTGADGEIINSGPVPVTVHGGPPDGVHFTVVANVVNIAGLKFSGIKDQITAFVFDEFSNPVPEGTAVQFQTSAGGIQGSAVTNSDGAATVELTTAKPLPDSTTKFQAIVVAQTLDKNGNAIKDSVGVLFSGDTAPIVAQPSAITVGEGGIQGFVYFVGDLVGNPLVGGSTIQVSVEGGEVTGEVDITLPDTRSRSSTFFSFVFKDDDDETTEPSITIDVTSFNGNEETTIRRGPLAPTEISQINLESLAEEILADGADTTTITVAVLDNFQNAVRNQRVELSASSGLLSPSITLTDENGKVSVILKSSVSPITVTSTVTASIDTVIGEMTVRFKGVSLSLDAAPDTVLADGSSTAEVIAIYADEENAPIVGQVVNFISFNDRNGDGKLNAGEDMIGSLTSRDTTDFSGQAKAVFTSQASRTSRDATLRATVAGLSATTKVTLLGIGLEVESSKDSLVADGIDQTLITALLTNSATGEPIFGRAINFSSNLGALSSESAVTNGSGQASVVLTSGTEPGTTTITANFGIDVSGAVEIDFVGMIIALSASDSSLIADGTAQTTITALLSNAATGETISGRNINFSTSSGTLSPLSGLTDGSGKVITTLRSGTDAGIARVTASFGSSISAILEIDIVGVTLTLSASRSTLIANGSDTTTVSAVLTESISGDPLANRTIDFSSDLGGISPQQATTDANGRVVAVLTSPTTIGTATVTASFGPTTQGTTGVVMGPGSPAGIVMVDVNPASISVKGAGQNENSTIVFEVRDAQGNRVADGTGVEFSLVPSGMGSLSPAVAATIDGRATTILRSDTTATTVNVIARAQADTNVTSGASVAISGGSPDSGHFSLAVQPDSIVWEPFRARAATVTAFVFDRFSNPVPQGTLVSFETSAGGISGSAQTDEDGLAQAQLATSREPLPLDGTVVVTARTIDKEGKLIEAKATISVVGIVLAIPDTILISVSEANVLSDGVSTTQVTAIVLDSNGDPIEGMAVNFFSFNDKDGDGVQGAGEENIGSIEQTGTTGASGQASVVFTSGASTGDILTVKIRAAAGGLSNTIPVNLLGVTLTVETNSDTIIADESAQSAVTAILTGTTSGARLANRQIDFSTTLGTLSSTSEITNSDGQAIVILTSSTNVGRAIINAEFGATISQTAEVSFIKGLPASIVLSSVSATSIGIRGSGDNEVSEVVFEVQDDQGNRVGDGETVVFSIEGKTSAIVDGVLTPGGEFLTPTETATVGGLARTTLNSGIVAGTVRVIARVIVGSDTVESGPVPLAIHGGPPDQAHFSLSATPVNLAGLVVFGLESTITVFVFDEFSNPVPQGTSVQFQTLAGGIQGSTVTDQNGQGSVTLFTAKLLPDITTDFEAIVTGQTVNKIGEVIKDRTTVLFSGLTDDIAVTSAGSIPFTISDGGSQNFSYTVQDINGNPLMGGSTITVTTSAGGVSGDVNITIPDSRDSGPGITNFSLTVFDSAPGEDPPKAAEDAVMTIRVISLNGNNLVNISGTVD